MNSQLGQLIVAIVVAVVITILTNAIMSLLDRIWKKLGRTIRTVLIIIAFVASIVFVLTQFGSPAIASDRDTLMPGEQANLTIQNGPQILCCRYNWKTEIGSVSEDWGSVPTVAYIAPRTTDTGGRLLGSTSISVTIYSTIGIQVGDAVTKLRVVININKADLDQLCMLVNIGSVRAQSIIDYRNKNGPFKTIQDIKLVTGIGEGIFNANKDYMTVQ